MGYLLEYTLAEGYYPPPQLRRRFQPGLTTGCFQELADRHKAGDWWEERDERKENFRGKSGNCVETAVAGIPQCTAASIAHSSAADSYSWSSAGEENGLHTLARHQLINAWA